MTLIACVKALAMITEKAGIIAVMSDDGDSKTPFPQGLWNSRRLYRRFPSGSIGEPHLQTETVGLYQYKELKQRSLILPFANCTFTH